MRTLPPGLVYLERAGSGAFWAALIAPAAGALRGFGFVVIGVPLFGYAALRAC